MACKISIFKTTADGEQVNIELDVSPEHLKQMEPRVVKRPGAPDEIVPGKTLREIFAPQFQLADDRLLEMNKRIMASNVLVKKLTPEQQYAVTNVLEVLHGRSSGPAPDQILNEARREHEAAQRALEEAKKLADKEVPE